MAVRWLPSRRGCSRVSALARDQASSRAGVVPDSSSASASSSRVWAVSYTHLDVYKRQVITSVAQMLMFFGMFGGGGSSDENRPNPLAMLGFALLAPIAASVIQLAISRTCLLYTSRCV